MLLLGLLEFQLVFYHSLQILPIPFLLQALMNAHIHVLLQMIQILFHEFSLYLANQENLPIHDKHCMAMMECLLVFHLFLHMQTIPFAL